MKKFVLITVAVLLLAVSVVSAQETETEVLNFYTVGSIFNWGDDAQAVYDYLTRFEGLELEIDEEYHSVSASAESDSETYMYNFLFDAETDKLYGIQCFASMTDEIDPAAVLQDLISNYGLDSAEAYEDEFLQETIADYDAGAVVAGPGTIVSIAGSAETEDTYAAISIAFYDRAYYENGNELPEFSFYTVGELFNWGDSAENVYNFISQYNGAEVEIDEEKHTITATSQSDAEKSS